MSNTIHSRIHVPWILGFFFVALSTHVQRKSAASGDVSANEFVFESVTSSEVCNLHRPGITHEIIYLRADQRIPLSARAVSRSTPLRMTEPGLHGKTFDCFIPFGALNSEVKNASNLFPSNSSSCQSNSSLSVISPSPPDLAHSDIISKPRQPYELISSPLQPMPNPTPSELQKLSDLLHHVMKGVCITSFTENHTIHSTFCWKHTPNVPHLTRISGFYLGERSQRVTSTENREANKESMSQAHAQEKKTTEEGLNELLMLPYNQEIDVAVMHVVERKLIWDEVGRPVVKYTFRDALRTDSIKLLTDTKERTGRHANKKSQPKIEEKFNSKETARIPHELELYFTCVESLENASVQLLQDIDESSSSATAETNQDDDSDDKNHDHGFVEETKSKRLVKFRIVRHELCRSVVYQKFTHTPHYVVYCKEINPVVARREEKEKSRERSGTEP